MLLPIVVCFLLAVATAATLPATSSSLIADIAALPLEKDLQSRALSAVERHADERSAHHTRTTDTARASSACRLLRPIFTDSHELLLSSDGAAYTNKSEINWSETCWNTPQCIISPTSAAEVQLVLRILTSVGSKFAVRSGGHTPNPGAANIGAEGVLIDLGGMHEISLSSGRTIASLGPGNRWGDVFSNLEPHGLVALGGRAPDPGVGGLLLGGGLNLFSSQLGLSCDNVANYEVVLADHTLVNANSTSHTDLFKALKGGTANFGIVTRFDVRTYAIPKIWYSVFYYSSAATSALINASLAFAALAEQDPKATLVVSASSANITLVELIYAEPSASWPKVFLPFRDIPGVVQTVANATIGTPNELLHLNSQAAPATRVNIMAVSTTYDLNTVMAGYRQWKSFAEDAARRIGAVMSYGLQVVPTNALAQGRRNGGNSLGLSEQGQIWLNGVISWTDAADDEYAYSVLPKLHDHIAAEAKSRGTFLEYQFLNDAGKDQNPLGSYGRESVELMKRVAARYDPQGVFQKLQSGGFKISEA